MKQNIKIFTLACSAIIISSCQGWKLPMPDNYVAPKINGIEATQSGASTTLVLSAVMQSTSTTGQIESCGFYYCKGTDFGNATKVQSSYNASDNKFTYNVTIREYDENYSFKAYISDGRSEILSEAKQYKLKSLNEYVKFSAPEITSKTETSANVKYTATTADGVSINECGICYGTTQDLTKEGIHVSGEIASGNIQNTITGLTAGVLYYIRPYVADGNSTAYGDVSSFNLVSAPVLKTKEVTDVKEYSAVSGGENISDFNDAITQKGVVWSISNTPTLDKDSFTKEGSGKDNFSSTLNNLEPGTTYYVRAYATNVNGTGYGEVRSFTTKSTIPTVNTVNITGVTSSSAQLAGSVSATGGADVTERGFVYSKATNPTISSTKVTCGTGAGEYSSTLNELDYATTYYVRAYAINAVGVAYGSELSFNTAAIAASITTTAVSEITSTTAVSGGTITNDGGSFVQQKGIIWSTSHNPTTALNTKTSEGTGNTAFSSSMTGLKPNTTYYVRAYVTTGISTEYGNEVSFTTEKGLAQISTSTATNIGTTSVTLGGNVSFDGGLSVTERGVVWSTSQNPTTSSSKKTNGTGEGEYTCDITGLYPGTIYYFRAYAINSAGTVYGEEKSFTTNIALATVTTASVTDITVTTAKCGGNITNAGGGNITAKGIVWSTEQNPTISLSTRTTDGSGTGSFNSNLANLKKGQIYYVRAYATNEAGTAYGEQKTFRTNSEGGTEGVGNEEYEW